MPNLLKLTTLVYLTLCMGGCACFTIKTPEAEVCYCRAGDQKITVGDVEQESSGKIPTGLSAIVELLLK